MHTHGFVQTDVKIKVIKGANMPCHCWYTPPKESERMIKNLCQLIVDEIKRLEKEGDPIGISIDNTKKLLDHLYIGECDEKGLKKDER